MCRSYFAKLIMNEKSDRLLYTNIPCMYLTWLENCWCDICKRVYVSYI